MRRTLHNGARYYVKSPEEVPAQLKSHVFPEARRSSEPGKRLYIIYLIGRNLGMAVIGSITPGQDTDGDKRPPFSGERSLSLRQLDVSRLELFDDLAKSFYELAFVDAGLLEREVQFERPALWPEDEGETPGTLRVGAFLLGGAQVFAGRARGHLADRLAHQGRVLQPPDLQEDRASADVGAPTFLPDVLGDVQQRHRLGDGDARFSYRVGDLLLRVAVTVGETRVALRFFEGMQVLSVEVLDQGDLDDLVLGNVELDAGHFGQSGLHRGSETSLTSDDAVAPVPDGPDQEGLEHSLGFDRPGEISQVADVSARLIGIGLDLVQGDPSSERCAES